MKTEDQLRAEIERLRDALEKIAASSVSYALSDLARTALENKRCLLCNYQHGHAIGCENNPVDVALRDAAMKENKHD